MLGQTYPSINTCLMSWSSQLRRAKVYFHSYLEFTMVGSMNRGFRFAFVSEGAIHPFSIWPEERSHFPFRSSHFRRLSSEPFCVYLKLFVLVLRINLSLWLMGNCFRSKGQPSKPFSPQGMQMIISVSLFPILAPPKSPMLRYVLCMNSKLSLRHSRPTPGRRVFHVHCSLPHPTPQYHRTKS